ncbi:MAG: indoleamine 2,3-dioxygenase [Pseudomonadota bacterium]
MRDLDYYDISPERGYLCRHDAGSISLSGDMADLADVAMALPRLLPSGRVRDLLRARLPQVDMAGWLQEANEAEARAAMVHYSFLTQAYVWGEADPAAHLPAVIAQPIVALADHLGQQPLLPYSGYVLDNWGCFDSNRPIDLDNIYMIQHFLAGQDEAWFVLIHVAIEAAAGGILARMPQVVQAAAQEDTARCQTLLEDMAGIWERINAIFDRMPERCDPYIYFERVRPYIHGWRDNPALPHGVIYEGTRYGTEGQAFRGQTGSQSSIVPAMDALFGVGHAMDPMKAFLDQLHIYRPASHRAFIDDLRAESTLRDLTELAGHRGLTGAYNANLEAMARFRTKHLEYAASYINKQGLRGAGNHTDVGTGGTPFMRYLKKHRDETQAQLLPMPAVAAE